MYSEDELYHFGVKGMKWGVRKARQTVSSLRKKVADRKAKKEAKKQAKIDKQNTLTREQFDAAKKKAIESGSAEDILKFRGYMTNQELRTAADRLDLEARISGRQEQKVSKGKAFVDNTLNAMSKTNEFAEKGIKLYNTGAKIANSLADYDLPTIDGTRRSDQQAKKEKEREKERLQRVVDNGDIDTIIANMNKLSVSQKKDVVSRFAYEDSIYRRKNEGK